MGNLYSRQQEQQYTYNWRKDNYDSRDKHHTFTPCKLLNSIKVVDLRDNCPTIYDQGKLGSCTANAIACAYQFDEIKQSEQNVFCPSRLFIYYNERNMEGHIQQDTGASIRDGIKSINTVGVCSEDMWQYDISKFADKPTDECYQEAQKHRSVEYKRVDQNLEQMKQCLLEGYPFVFGFQVYESFESDTVAKTGHMPVPKEGEKLLGGHAVVAVGYNDDTQEFIIRNSWSDKWGDKGYFYMPYEYITDANKCNDFWTVTKVVDKN